MHQIKKYANRKMYDMTTKRYVTMNDISDLIHSGEAIGEDITQEVVSQLVGRILDSQSNLLNVLRPAGKGLPNHLFDLQQIGHGFGLEPHLLFGYGSCFCPLVYIQITGKWLQLVHHDSSGV